MTGIDSWLLLADGPRYQGLWTDFNTTFWSAVLRMCEAVVAAAPFLLAGLLAAGLLRGIVGGDRIRSALGVGHWSGPLRAWALGVLLPICSLGALPVARELRRAGVPSGTVLSFVLVAPVLNPVSIIYGLSHIVPFTLVYFMAGTFVVSVGIGYIWNWIVARQQDAKVEDVETAPRTGLGRLAVAGHTTARGLVGPSFVDYSLAMLAVGLLGAFLPHGVLQTSLTRDNALAPLLMGLVAIPVYVTPVDVMMHFGLIVKDGFSMGAAFSLIVLGAGANVGVANWIRRDYGGRPLLLFIGLLIGSTLVLGFTADRAIVHGSTTSADHTHAFDSFTRLHAVSGKSASITWVLATVGREMEPYEVYGLCLLAGLAIAGIVVWGLGERVSVDRFLVAAGETPAEKTSARWNPALSARQLVAVSVVGILALAGYGLYIFYPPLDDLFDDMAVVRVDAYDAVRDGDLEESKRRLDQWRNLAVKLPTSRLIRTGSVSDEQRRQVDELLYSLTTLESYVARGEHSEANLMLKFVENRYLACRQTYRESRQPRAAAASAVGG